MRSLCVLSLLAVAVVLCCRRASAADWVPFVIPATQNPKGLIAFESKPIAVNSPRLVAKDGHFYVGGDRVRIWGVNLCFAANFPTHADAERLAARLAAFGINSVRHHHMDGTIFPGGVWDPMDERNLSAEAIDRLDYLMDQLARHGIYSNLNLHVSRAWARVLKLPDTTAIDSFDKMVDIFTPELIDAQRKYARDMLTHVNPYRKAPGSPSGTRLADDPAVAFVEINNEDSLFMWGWEEKLRNLPEFYGNRLQDLYNQWLTNRYGSDANLARAWSAGAEPLGGNLLADVRKLSETDAPGTWRLELHAPCKGTAAPAVGRGDSTAAGGDANAVRIEIAQTDAVSWHIQFRQFGVSLKAGRYYTLSFRARADKPREVYLGVGQHQDPWANLGLTRNAKLTNEWKTFRIGFVANADEKNARVGFSVAQSNVPVELADVELRPGGKEGLAKGEGLGAKTVRLMPAGESDVRAIDRMRFLAETEKAYFDSMREYVKKDLGCQAAVTGTIVFGPLGLWAQSDMDYIDGHAYWHHPNFPHRPWDPADWTVEQEAMVDHPGKSTLYPLAAQRLAGKPYTVSEYNHPAPNDYQAECVPMIASFAAAQDWDGIWLFAYSHSTDWDRQAFSSFFDIDANPAKWGFVPAGAAITRYGSGDLMDGNLAIPLAKAGDLDALCRVHMKHGSDLAGFLDGLAGKEAWRHARISVGLNGESYHAKPHQSLRAFLRPTSLPSGPVDPPSFLWIAAPPPEGPGAFFLVFDDRFEVALAHASIDPNSDVPPRPHDLTSPGFEVATVTPLDGKPPAESRKVLITACGRCENTEMQFTPDRRSVGRNWGKAPVLIEPDEGDLALYFAKEGEWICRALKPDGTPGEEVPIDRPAAKDGKPASPTIKLSAKYGTMWYLLERR